MNPLSTITRFIGTPRVAAVLYVGVALIVLGWVGGAIPWWLGLMALCFVGTVRKAVQYVRRYDHWAAAWAGMGSGVQAAAAPKPTMRKRKASSPWAGVIVAALSLLSIPRVMRAPGADEAMRNGLTFLWLGMAVYLVCKLATLRRAHFQKTAGTVKSAGERKNKSAPADVVEWVLPRASSSPSRADAISKVPDYCARLIAE